MPTAKPSIKTPSSTPSSEPNNNNAQIKKTHDVNHQGKWRINWHWLMALFAVALFFYASKELYHIIHSLDIKQLKTAILSTPMSSLIKASGAVLAAYLILTLYDYFSVRHVKASLSYPKIMNTSLTAFAIGNTIGIAVLSAGAVRYRYYSQQGLSGISISNIILLNTLAFSLGAAIIIGISLLWQPMMIAQLLVNLPALALMPSLYIRIIGVVILLAVVGLLLMAGTTGHTFTIRSWRFALPAAPTLLKLMTVAIVDVAMMAFIVYLLLPAHTQVSYPEVFTAYVQSLVAGLLSNVPGGLGVFELMMVHSLPQVDKAVLLSALLLYRVLYYFIPFLLGLVSFFCHEAYIRSTLYQRSKLNNKKNGDNNTLADDAIDSIPNAISPASTQTDTDAKPISHRYAPPTTSSSTLSSMHPFAHRMLPQLMALIIGLLGMVMVVMSLLPPDEHRALLLGKLIPVTVIEASYLLNTLMGFLLMIVAQGLYHRLNGAWYVTVTLLASSVALLLLKHIELEVAVVCAILLVLLVWHRRYFSRKSSLFSLRPNLQTLVFVAIFLVGLYWVGLYVYRYEPYRPDLWWSGTGHGAARFLRAYTLLSMLAIGYALFSLIRFKKVPPSFPDTEALQRAEMIVQSAPYAVANLSLLNDKQLLFSESQRSFMMYQIHGRSWIVMSDPVGDEAEFGELIASFISLCKSHGGTYVFYEISHRYRQLYLAHGIQLLKIGEEAIVDLATFSLQGNKNSKFRQVLNRGKKTGLSFTVVAKEEVAGMMSELKAVSDTWLNDKKSSEKRFSLGYFDEQYIQHFDCAVVKYQHQDGKQTIIAFANLWQSGGHHELCIDLMRYREIVGDDGTVIKNIMDYLFVNMLVWGKEAGYQRFSLGMAPLSGISGLSEVSDMSDNKEAAETGHSASTHALHKDAKSGEDELINADRFAADDAAYSTYDAMSVRWRYLMKVVAKYGKAYYNFAGLRQFKQKFNPHWESRYIGTEAGMFKGIKSLQALADTTLLIAGGMQGVLKKPHNDHTS